VKKYLPDRQIEGILPFQDFFAIFGRENGLERVWVTTRDDAEWRMLTFNESCHSVWCGNNCVYTSTSLRLGYSSLVTPKQVIFTGGSVCMQLRMQPFTLTAVHALSPLPVPEHMIDCPYTYIPHIHDAIVYWYM
jgi:Prolyl oligopeptidase, N-terminal beta-propeller domain